MKCAHHEAPPAKSMILQMVTRSSYLARLEGSQHLEELPPAMSPAWLWFMKRGGGSETKDDPRFWRLGLQPVGFRCWRDRVGRVGYLLHAESKRFFLQRHGGRFGFSTMVNAKKLNLPLVTHTHTHTHTHPYPNFLAWS